MESSALTELKSKRVKVINFILYIENNFVKRNGTKISINFQHRKFRDTGFAILEMDGMEMNSIIRATKNECINQLDKINNDIERYERTTDGEDN